MKQNDLKLLYQNTEATKAYWENSWESRDYDKMLSYELYNHTFRATVDTFVEQNKIQDGQRVLDIGCGWGRIIIGLLKRFPNLKVDGIDLAQEAIDRGPALIEKETGVSGVYLRRASAESIPFEDATFDSVVSTRTFQYITNPALAMREVVRILRPTGHVTIMVPNKLNPMRFFSYHTQLLTNMDLSQWMEEANLRVIAKGTVVFCPPAIKRFSEDSLWVTVDRLLAKVPGINRIGGLTWSSAVKE